MTEKTEKDADGLDAPTRLAVDRTRLSLDRTLMSWIRTAISLITFGYGLYKVIDTTGTSAAAQHSLITHREIGVIMIGIGLLSLALGTHEHRQGTRQLQADYPAVNGKSLYVRLLSSSVTVLGILALLAMAFRM